MSSTVALGAATVLPFSAPLAAQANTVLSSDWEQVSSGDVVVTVLVRHQLQ